jgi:aspartyl-tRNA(Asn)/glutamyl-tRNA(Gln) amidotransferase subunit B
MSASDAPLLEGRTGKWELVLGLEVHAQVISKAKLFSGAAVDFGAEPNAQVSFVDAGFPGMLPVINAHCVEQAVKTGLGLKAQINLRSVFDRKNYFYADLPSGYQISQFQQPIVGTGVVLIDLPDGGTREVGITRLHLEQDAGKSLHDQHPDKTYVDLNRSGVALMEIVSEPDMRSAEEAAAYIKKLRSILRYLGTCDGNMDEGSLRCDVNVSVRRPGDPLGTRCEIKNVNSVRFVMQAIEYEANRQIEIIEDGGTIDQETRLFDSTRGTTRTMRSKEQAHDYRYFPDPDLLPLVIDAGFVERIRAGLPELPDERKARYMKDFGLSPYDAGVLVSEKETAAFYEAVAAGRDAKLAANWVISELFGALNRTGRTIDDSPVTAANLGGLLDLLADDTISGRIAKDVLAEMVETGQPAGAIVEAKGLRQVTDTGAIDGVIDRVMADNADKLAEYRAGKDKLFGFFVGQVMKASGGKANPKLVNERLKEKLTG